MDRFWIVDRLWMRLGGSLAAFVLLVLASALLSGRFATLWWLFVMAARTRYCLLAIAGPALLGVLALTVGKSMFYGVLVLRIGPEDVLDAGRIWYCRDLVFVTVLSLMTVAMGLAALRINELYGDLRFGSPLRLINQEFDAASPSKTAAGKPQSRSPTQLNIATQDATSDESTNRANANPSTKGQLQRSTVKSPVAGWSIRRSLAWLAFGLVFPGLCAWTTTTEYKFPNEIWWSVWSIFVGVILGIGILLALGYIQWKCFDANVFSPCGLLPVEDFNGVASPGTWSRLISPINQFVGYVLDGPGYSNEHGLYPGHAQMTVIAIAALTTYAGWYVHSLYFSDWKTFLWPSAFYVLLLLFVAGWVMTGVSFLIDRYGVPAESALLIWMALLYMTTLADHSFELHMGTKEMVAQTHRLLATKAESRGQDNKSHSDDPKSLMQVLSSARMELQQAAVGNHHDERRAVTDEELVSDQASLAEIFLGEGLGRVPWIFPQEKAAAVDDTSSQFRKRTMVVVTASGGGIQAAAWSAKVLTELDRRFANFRDAIGVISGVSGGSVGTMYFLAHSGERSNSDDAASSIGVAQRDRITQDASASSMEAVSWGVVFPDTVRSLFPPLASTTQDRGWALESSWWNRLGVTSDDRDQVRHLRLRQLLPAILTAKMPVPIFNATVVETGQRVLASPVFFGEQKSEGDNNASAKAYTYVDQPIDFTDFFTKRLNGGANLGKSLYPDIQLTTAVRLSATFMYVTPVARPSRKDEATANSLNDTTPTSTSFAAQPVSSLPTSKANQPRDPDTDFGSRYRLHFCDGGYADNTGVVTAVRIVNNLLDDYGRRTASDTEFEPPFQRIVILRIEPFPRDRAKTANDHSGWSSALFGPSSAMFATRVSTQAERATLELDLLRKRSENEWRTMLARLPNDFWNETEKLQQIVENSANELEQIIGPRENLEKVTRTKSLKAMLEPASPVKRMAMLQTAETEGVESPVGTASRLQSLSDLAEYAANLSAQRKQFVLADAISEAKALFPDDEQRVEALDSAMKRRDDAEKQLIELTKHLDDIDRRHRIEVETVTFRFDGNMPPLSWTLAPSQRQQIDEAWDKIEQGTLPGDGEPSPIEKLKQYFLER